MSVKVDFGRVIVATILVALAVFAYMQLSKPPAANAASFMQVVITYSDGTVRVVDSRDVGEAVIIDTETGKAVSSVWIGLYATPVYTGNPTGYSVDGLVSCQIWRGGQICLYDSGAMAIQPQNNPLQGSGKPVLITSATLSASWLDNAVSQYEDGATYVLKYQVHRFTMTLRFEDGGTAAKSADPITMAWSFQYRRATGSFISLSISFQRSAG